MQSIGVGARFVWARFETPHRKNGPTIHSDFFYMQPAPFLVREAWSCGFAKQFQKRLEAERYEKVHQGEWTQEGRSQV